MKIHRVIIHGPQLIGAQRLKNLKHRTDVTLVTTAGTTTARLNDFQDVKLEPSLNPESFTQTFFCGPVLERAQRVLESTPEVAARIQLREAEKIDFGSLTFGLNKSDVMLFATIKRGGDWTSRSISNSLHPFGKIPLSPVAEVLHYAQTGFEGAKAYRSAKGRIVCFRLPENAKRHAQTSERLALTPIPEKYYLEAVRQTVLANKRLLAPPGMGAAMYIRPLHFGSGPQLGLAPAPEESFMIFVSPVGPYFEGGFKAQAMMVQDEFNRSAPGLMGKVKAGANYANCLKPGLLAKQNSFAEVIYLDAMLNQNVEEVGAANAFFVVDGKLYTPSLSGTILAGITRDSLITLARDMGIEVIDNQPVPIRLAKKASEAFCSGTAAVLTPIGSITHGSEEIVFNGRKVGPMTELLYKRLTDIQEERVADPYGWVYQLS